MADLQLTRVDYMQVGVTGPGTLDVIPSASGRGDRVVVGDEEGVITCFSGRKGKTSVAFATAPGARVSAVCVAGERVFAASGTDVRGLSKKGKQFFAISTFMSEPIRSMAVHNTQLHLGGEYVYNQYDNGKEAHYHLTADRVRGIALANLDTTITGGRPAQPQAILACADRALRIMSGADVAQHVTLPEAPRCLVIFPTYDNNEEGSREEAASIAEARGSSTEVIWGGAAGGLGAVLLKPNGAPHEVLWHIAGGADAAVSCVAAYDVTDDGVAELLVGRDDGAVEVWATESTHEPPRRLFTSHMLSAVTGLCGGHVCSSGHAEVVVVTHAGQVSGFTTRRLRGGGGSGGTGSNSGSSSLSGSADGASGSKGTELDAEVGALRREVTQLETQLSALREKQEHQELKEQQQRNKRKKHSTADVGGGGGGGGGGTVSLPESNIRDEFVLVPEQAAWHLSLQTPGTLEAVILEANVDLDLEDVLTDTATVSITPCDATDMPAKLLAYYRCQEGISRLQIRIRHAEGASGELRAYVIPLADSSSGGGGGGGGGVGAAHLCTYRIRPLALHHRVNEPFEAAADGATTILQLSGRFSLVDMHGWIERALPEVPPRPPSGNEVCLVFRSAALGTLLECRYTEGHASFRAHNPSTLSILRNHVIDAATGASVPLRSAIGHAEDAAAAAAHVVLERIRPLFEACARDTSDAALVAPLKELRAQAGGAKLTLSPEHAAVLARAEILEAGEAQQPARLRRLVDLLVALLCDTYSLAGQDAGGKKVAMLKDAAQAQRPDWLKIQSLFPPIQQPQQEESSIVQV